MMSKRPWFNFTALIFMCFFSTVHAEVVLSKAWFNAGFYSAHFDTEKGLRNANPGLGVEYELDDKWRVTAGKFINSDNANSSYLGAYYQPLRVGDFKVGVVGGVMLGLGRALGETMAVTFVIGNSQRLSASLLAPGSSIASSLANEFTEAVGELHSSALIELGLILFVITSIVLAFAKLLLLQLARREGGQT